MDKRKALSIIDKSLRDNKRYRSHWTESRMFVGDYLDGKAKQAVFYGISPHQADGLIKFCDDVIGRKVKQEAKQKEAPTKTIKISKDIKDKLMELIEISKPVDDDGNELGIVEINKIRSSEDSIIKVGSDVSIDDMLNNINRLFKLDITLDELNDYISE